LIISRVLYPEPEALRQAKDLMALDWRSSISDSRYRLPQASTLGTGRAAHIRSRFDLHQTGFTRRGSVASPPVSSYLTLTPLLALASGLVSLHFPSARAAWVLPSVCALWCSDFPPSFALRATAGKPADALAEEGDRLINSPDCQCIASALFFQG
jgi:hypothetical protein